MKAQDGTGSRSRSVSAVSGSRAEAARLVASIRPPSLRAVSGGGSSECPAPQPSPSPSSTLTSAFRGDRQTGGRTVSQSVSHGRTGKQVERWRLEDALPLCVCQAAGPAGRGDSEIVAVQQPTNKLQRGRGGGRREGVSSCYNLCPFCFF